MSVNITKEFEKIRDDLDKKWHDFNKSNSGGHWFEIENEIMVGHGYSYTDECEWVKKVNAKIYNFGQY